ncbi:hypothetical protein [Cryptosporangium minutisporangium]|uniref:Glutamine amidotransferase type-2 domain-containing protein n=1 Tax=Cryptosporangium minutisporangium TaxID=113569 RepID=A0ABP6SVF3_9ACTN
MCLLTFLPAGTLPDTEALRTGTETNDDGHGFAIVTDSGLLVEHGLDAEATISAFAALRRRHPEGPALFHSRFGTHGDSGSVENCHPLVVGGDSRTVLAHNGVFPEAVRPAKGDPRSDTRIVAEEFLPGFGTLRRRRTRLAFQRWMTPGNKVVILTVDPRFRDNAYILNEDAGVWDGGIWYSNRDYLPSPPSRLRWTYRSTGRLWDDDRIKELGWREPVQCWICETDLASAEDPCPVCGHCLGCGEFPEDCACYVPASFGTRTA